MKLEFPRIKELAVRSRRIALASLLATAAVIPFTSGAALAASKSPAAVIAPVSALSKSPAAVTAPVEALSKSPAAVTAPVSALSKSPAAVVVGISITSTKGGKAKPSNTGNKTKTAGKTP